MRLAGFFYFDTRPVTPEVEALPGGADLFRGRASR
jgi:hypothetical protein